MIDFRNPKFNRDGSIDVEILTAVHGWIPTTIDVNDAGALFDAPELHAAIIARGNVAAYVAPPPAPVIIRTTPISDAMTAIIKAIPSLAPNNRFDLERAVKKVKDYEQE